ncbi:MAG TPA: hypothetical protein VHU80_07995, partial [Polyangiaceae bacterium]|nr:hypothetical protein [Polyangiaceae bacterium]
MKRFPWLTLGKKTDPDIVEKPPIRLGNFSNGEFFHEQTPLEKKIEKEIMVQADAKARRLGIPRRDFLASTMGMATSLSVLNLAAACSSSESTHGGSGGSGGFGGGAGPGSGGGPGGSGGSGGSGG